MKSKIWTLVIVLAASTALTGCKALLGPSEGERLLHKGLEQAEAGQTQDAIATFREATNTTAGWTAWNNLGVCLMRERQVTDAIKAYSEALKRNPDSTIVRFNRGVAFYKAGKLAEAAEDFRTLLRKKGRFAPAWNNLGVVHLAKWRYLDAWKAFDKAVKQRPKYVAAWSNLAAAAWYLGRQDIAQKAVGKALALAPTYQPALKNAELFKRPIPVAAPAKKRLPPKIKPDTVITEPGLERKPK